MATSRQLPKVQLTRVFRDVLLAAGANPDDLAQGFAEWKEAWPKWEDRDFYFGKDGDYHTPRRNGEFVLRHVHMPPEDPCNWPDDSPPLAPDQKARIEMEVQEWNKAWKKGRAGRYRVSSRVLVYVDGGRHGYLLLDLAREPDGHDSIPANKAQMERWADIAERFRLDGTVLI